MSDVGWNEYSADELGAEVGKVAESMILGRDERIHELETKLEETSRDLALANAEIDRMRGRGGEIANGIAAAFQSFDHARTVREANRTLRAFGVKPLSGVGE